MSSLTLDEEKEMRRTSIPVARFRAPDGAEHTVAVRAVKEGWQIVDENGQGPDVIETLSNPQDGREQAEAVARDYAQWAVLPTWARH